MKKGYLVFFHSLLIHKSEANRTQKLRYSYTWHIKDRDSVYATSNWLQRDKFPEIKFKWNDSCIFMISISISLASDFENLNYLWARNPKTVIVFQLFFPVENS